MFIAKKESTGELFWFKGAYKLADFIGISARTVYRQAKNTFSEKIYNDYRIAKPKENPIGYANRGTKVKKVHI